MAELGAVPFGVYLHVPFCTVRCGYCDFNTYTPAELGGSATVAGYGAAAMAELHLAAEVLAIRAGTPPAAPPAATTVFVGGGTPTVLPVTDLIGLLDGVRRTVGLAPGAEVTVEANPDSVRPEAMAALADAGVTRVSLGMQSAVPHVLATLERTHQPENVAAAVGWARRAGLAVSLDLIYGTPGESPADWRTTVETALALEPDHVSAYALVVEPGTRLARRVRTGLLPPPDDDDQAGKYEMADDLLAESGYAWYEVSNWARLADPGTRCRHNEGYWAGSAWWGIGPGAHSHVGGVRWWNVRHPARYAAALAEGRSPAEGREVLTPDQRYTERILLGVRRRDGLPVAQLRPEGVRAVAGLVEEGLLVSAPSSDVGTNHACQRIVLTRRGRLLADAVVRRLLS
ncbi:MAG TPA: radical SAM family heme chaperone HemW [Dermatophilaceae bacterium]|nr:radical SAM family heme chaperone HemW [Dermatophilaceae bacterium]